MRLICILLLIHALGSVCAQQYLSVSKPGKKHIVRYYQNDLIILKQFSGCITIEGTIQAFTDSSIVIDGEHYLLDNITTIQNDQLRYLPAKLVKFVIAGAAYLTITVFNRTANGNYPVITAGNAMVSGGFVIVGAINWILLRRKYPRKTGWTYRVFLE